MKVAVITDGLARGLRIQRGLDGLPGTVTWIVRCPVAGHGALWQLIREIGIWLKCPNRVANLWRLGKLLRTKQLVRLRHSLDDAVSTQRLRSLSFDVGLNNADVIYRKATIESFGLGILNAHIGMLPEFRGRSVMEWSILKGTPSGVTVFFVDEGIDTGPRIVLWQEVNTVGFADIASAKKHLFQQDAVLYRKALASLLQPGFAFAHNVGGRRYYPMSNLFLGVVTQLLRNPDSGDS